MSAGDALVADGGDRFDDLLVRMRALIGRMEAVDERLGRIEARRNEQEATA